MDSAIFNFSIPFFIVLLSMPLMLPLLKKFELYQEIRELGPDSHRKKKGVPTLGGILFFPAMLFSSILFLPFNFLTSIILLIIAINWSVGVIDDLLIIKKSSAEGISGWVKLIVQGLTGLLLGLSMYYTEISISLFIPLIGDWLDPGILIIPLAVLVMMATTNAVNLSDGLDGLAAGLVIITVIFALPFLHEQGQIILSLLSLQGAGIMLGFLWFNFHPAAVFMGDSGSLMMGALLAAVLTYSGYSLLLVILGGVFVMEALSVIIQVLYFKWTGGKRVFKMTPLHHHFELAGWPETRVTSRFYIIQIIFGLAALFIGYM
ncbi:phospho-N-acetylmuramoyl-pentapeptide-transferase [Halarsenatibacter silvermanii]|uniref:Phospho-N-acetylmuramoyl-pentapeptide-transferase n=1 Tax=Halarsenatibacter silvermanii TaxID=321763 RepID=A0A1G9JN14_9FIRM|nr:phospho-N-acetylmuramoyl-pentapeptide-transferase [Halarsenatibacter silvermanii]SDL38851.1 Phospho-N-acetylmuramoyl-pentapeptide-transferase [Halarsenatibacter silvermanii]